MKRNWLFVVFLVFVAGLTLGLYVGSDCEASRKDRYYQAIHARIVAENIYLNQRLVATEEAVAEAREKDRTKTGPIVR
jgi:hypothetical protein